MSKPKSIQLWSHHVLRISAHYQLSADQLISKTVEENQGTISSTGALIIKLENSLGDLQKTVISSKMISQLISFGGVILTFLFHQNILSGAPDFRLRGCFLHSQQTT